MALCRLFCEHSTAIWTPFPVIIDWLIWFDLCYTLISSVRLDHLCDVVRTEATPDGLWLLLPIWNGVSLDLTFLNGACLPLKHGLSGDDSWLLEPCCGRSVAVVNWACRLIITVVGSRAWRNRVRLYQSPLRDWADNSSSLLLTALNHWEGSFFHLRCSRRYALV